jgi:hypothetical protein
MTGLSIDPSAVLARMGLPEGVSVMSDVSLWLMFAAVFLFGFAAGRLYQSRKP